MSEEQQHMAEACPLRRNEFEVKELFIHHHDLLYFACVGIGNGVQGY